MPNVVTGIGRIDLINLGTVTPMNLDGYIVFSLSKDWVYHFNRFPKFNVKINNEGKLCITSESSIRKGENEIA